MEWSFGVTGRKLEEGFGVHWQPWMATEGPRTTCGKWWTISKPKRSVIRFDLRQLKGHAVVWTDKGGKGQHWSTNHLFSRRTLNTPCQSVISRLGIQAWRKRQDSLASCSLVWVCMLRQTERGKKSTNKQYGSKEFGKNKAVWHDGVTGKLFEADQEGKSSQKWWC